MASTSSRQKATATRRTNRAFQLAVNGIVPTRAIPTRSGNRIRGAEFSVKMDSQIVWESPYEQSHIIGLDVTPDVAAFYPQPMPIDVLVPDGRIHRYTADFMVESLDGRITLHEVGREKDKVKLQAYYAAVERACQAEGWGFEFAYSHFITREPFFSNAKLLTQLRHVPLDEVAVNCVLRFLEQSKPRFELHAAADLLGGWGCSKLTVLAMCLRGYLDPDLEGQRLGPSTYASIGVRVARFFR